MDSEHMQPPTAGLSRSNCIRSLSLFEVCGATDFSVTAVAQQCGLSRGHFSLAFKATTGQTPTQWRLARKIDRAMLLLKGDDSIADIANECGFSDQAHLTRAFRAAVGISPGKWRAQFRDQ